MSKIDFKSNKKEVLSEVDRKVIKALTMCGLLAEGYAKVSLTDQDAVDTGLLRNSVTFGVTGENVHTKTYKADKGDKKGSYESSIPKENDPAMYVGTNVEYAPYIEFGTGKQSSKGGRQTPWTYKDKKGFHKSSGHSPRPYLKPSIADHTEEYKQVIHDVLKE